ncbi:MAG: YchJ family metal-binding protein [Campylobacterota bacterium]|nr:YchJ family metal-binding protein [Campylobacterota bacterium]
MRSRYCAFALKIPKYIIKTTHKENQDYKPDTKEWENEILEFCNSCVFEKLGILDFIDGEFESFVTFKATIKCDYSDNTFTEKSRFLKVNNIWLYHSGKFLNQ